jgi:hypothetical protein
MVIYDSEAGRSHLPDKIGLPRHLCPRTLAMVTALTHKNLARVVGYAREWPKTK